MALEKSIARAVAYSRAHADMEHPDLVEAYATFQGAFLELKALPHDLSDEGAAPFYARMDPADVVLKTVPALTLTGVLMKLRRAFVDIVGEQWSDDAIRDERPPEFERAVAMSGMYVEMLWRAIEDLERMAVPVSNGEAQS